MRLQSLTVTVAGSDADRVGSDGELDASDARRCARRRQGADGKGTHRVRVRIAARYVEAGADKSATGSYVTQLRWEGGGLFGGRSPPSASDFSRG